MTGNDDLVERLRHVHDLANGGFFGRLLARRYLKYVLAEAASRILDLEAAIREMQK